MHLYTPLLYTWALRAGENADDAADLVQDVFVVLVQTLPRFEYDANGRFRNWLRTITLNKLRDRKRRAMLAGRVPIDQCPEPVLPDDAERFWETEYQGELTRRALELMRSDFAPATWKACWELTARGRSAKHVARELGMTENAVYLAKCRVLRRLRDELTGLVE